MSDSEQPQTVEVRSTWSDKTPDSEADSVTTSVSELRRASKAFHLKQTRDVKIMVENALADAGGEEYLRQQAIDNPTAFMALVGKLIPKDVSVKTDISLNVRHELIERAVASLIGREARQIETPALPHKSANY